MLFIKYFYPAVNELLDSEQLYQSIKRFDLAIDGLQDAFIKDKVIDIMNMFVNHQCELYIK